MSYASDLKTELLGRFPKERSCQIAELAGIFAFFGEVKREADGQVLRIRTDQVLIRERTEGLLYRLTGRKEDQKAEDAILLTGIKSEEVLQILRHPIGNGLVDNGLIEGWEEKRAYLRGCFLAAGSINDPNKSYHFEIAARNPAQARQIVSVMEAFDLHGKTVARQGRTVVYLKESNEISDMLNIMEASVTLLDFENIRIRKDMNNAVNRKVNCETANIGKMVDAAVREVRDIELIRDRRGLHSLPGKLRETAELRLLHPDASLVELGRMMDPPVGKSGVNHRLRRIGALALEIRKQEENCNEEGSSCSDGKFD